jgi:AcrR family transcriptional regulator
MKKKDMILRAATVLFAEKGYRDTSMAAVAQATGVAQGTIFYHYDTKEKLFLAILRDFKESLIQEFDRHVRDRAYPSGMAMVEDMVDFYLSLSGTMEQQFLLLHRHDAYELARTNDECREHLEAIYDCLVDIFETGVRRGQQDGSVGNGSARKTALIVFSMVDGLARFNTYRLYNASALVTDLIDGCRKILQP